MSFWVIVLINLVTVVCAACLGWLVRDSQFRSFVEELFREGE